MEVHCRFHHLNKFRELADDYLRWRVGKFDQVKFEDLHENSAVGEAFAGSVAHREAKVAIAMVSDHYRDPWIPIRYPQDYVGEEGEGADYYRRGIQEFYQEMLLNPPESPVSVNYQPDALCHSCHRQDPDDDVGIHCRREMGGLHEFVWDETLRSLINNPVVPPEYRGTVIRRIDGSGVGYTLPIGLLRDREFLDALAVRVGEKWKEVMEFSPLLERINILERTESPHAPGPYRITEDYLRNGQGDWEIRR